VPSVGVAWIPLEGFLATTGLGLNLLQPHHLAVAWVCRSSRSLLARTVARQTMQDCLLARVFGCGGSGQGSEESQLFFREVQRPGGDVLGEVCEAAGSGDRQHVDSLRQGPG
jgi:hypothetical protein